MSQRTPNSALLLRRLVLVFNLRNPRECLGWPSFRQATCLRPTPRQIKLRGCSTPGAQPAVDKSKRFSDRAMTRCEWLSSRRIRYTLS